MKFHEALKAVTENPSYVFRHTAYGRDYYLHTDGVKNGLKTYFQIHVVSEDGVMGECPASGFNDNISLDSEWVDVSEVGD